MKTMSVDALEKMSNFLKDFRENYEEEGYKFGQAIKHFKVPVNTGVVLKKLNLVKSVGYGKYSPCFKAEEVQPIFCRKILTNVYNYSSNSKNRMAEIDVTSYRKVTVEKKLCDSISNEELIAELRRRGFSGTLNVKLAV